MIMAGQSTKSFRRGMVSSCGFCRPATPSG
jgi:hypothetical protein